MDSKERRTRRSQKGCSIQIVSRLEAGEYQVEMGGRRRIVLDLPTTTTSSAKPEKKLPDEDAREAHMPPVMVEPVAYVSAVRASDASDGAGVDARKLAVLARAAPDLADLLVVSTAAAPGVNAGGDGNLRRGLDRELLRVEREALAAAAAADAAETAAREFAAASAAHVRPALPIPAASAAALAAPSTEPAPFPTAAVITQAPDVTCRLKQTHGVHALAYVLGNRPPVQPQPSSTKPSTKSSGSSTESKSATDSALATGRMVYVYSLGFSRNRKKYVGSSDMPATVVRSRADSLGAGVLNAASRAEIAEARRMLERVAALLVKVRANRAAAQAAEAAAAAAAEAAEAKARLRRIAAGDGDDDDDDEGLSDGDASDKGDHDPGRRAPRTLSSKPSTTTPNQNTQTNDDDDDSGSDIYSDAGADYKLENDPKMREPTHASISMTDDVSHPHTSTHQQKPPSSSSYFVNSADSDDESGQATGNASAPAGSAPVTLSGFLQQSAQMLASLQGDAAAEKIVKSTTAATLINNPAISLSPPRPPPQKIPIETPPSKPSDKPRSVTEALWDLEHDEVDHGDVHEVDQAPALATTTAVSVLQLPQRLVGLSNMDEDAVYDDASMMNAVAYDSDGGRDDNKRKPIKGGGDGSSRGGDSHRGDGGHGATRKRFQAPGSSTDQTGSENSKRRRGRQAENTNKEYVQLEKVYRSKYGKSLD